MRDALLFLPAAALFLALAVVLFVLGEDVSADDNAPEWVVNA